MSRFFKHACFIAFYLYLIWFWMAWGPILLHSRHLPPVYVSGLFTFWLGGIYFLPSVIGAHRGAAHSTRISMINAFLGWTGIGWIVALLMALFYRRVY
ncbi:superinfection immunity protein [Pseudomonas sp. Hp2]|uniref:superinfection immunity protein n=1 Tax=Pseudomonas sp. Hp2 TaxID=701189 RepID=UPI001C498A10|nr:superinfection immunity protein [Pseudomonas sp. Hp2]